ncbi:hypothetical protein [Streptomyces sp. NPDC047939]|uniref:hypothetical protein n=1 Tax=Streptomyces sp. NPDC047939 TaxID=3155381 RepID=UPI00341B4867
MSLHVTADHFRRIESFLEARLNPLVDATAGSTHGLADDDTARALRALRTLVGREAAAAALSEDYEQAEADSRRISETMTDASWRVLVGVAQQWKDHPDFLPEFAMDPYQLAASTERP